MFTFPVPTSMWVFLLLFATNLLVLLVIVIGTYHYRYPTAAKVHWQLQPYSPLRALRAFALGFYEYKQEYTPYFADDRISNAYDRGRSVASTITFSKYEV